MNLKPFLRINGTLSLHLARHELAEPVFAAVEANRAHLRQWLPWVDETKSIENTKEFIRESMAHNSNGTRLSTFILAGGQVAGAVGVVRFDKDSRSGEIGYWLAASLQGKGIMTAACRCLVNHLFQKKSLNRIEIKAAVRNLKSQAVPRRLGFAEEGTLREALLLYGVYHDVALFSLLKKEWEAWPK